MDHMMRPRAVVLPASSQVPERNLIVPPPTTFTHEVTTNQPYYYADPPKGSPPDGEFAAGTQVVLLAHERGPLWWVVDGRGLRVATAGTGLRPLA